MQKQIPFHITLNYLLLNMLFLDPDWFCLLRLVVQKVISFFI